MDQWLFSRVQHSLLDNWACTYLEISEHEQKTQTNSLPSPSKQNETKNENKIHRSFYTPPGNVKIMLYTFIIYCCFLLICECLNASLL